MSRNYNIQLLDGVEGLFVGDQQAHLRIVASDPVNVVREIEGNLERNNPTNSEFNFFYSKSNLHLSAEVVSTSWVKVDSVEYIMALISSLCSSVMYRNKQLSMYKCTNIDSYLTQFGLDGELRKKVFIFTGIKEMLSQSIEQDNRCRNELEIILKIGRPSGVHLVFVEALEEPLISCRDLEHVLSNVIFTDISLGG